jgi:assimilatory nitrate reductase catalytic subunit
LKNIPARIERFVAATYGFAVLRRKPEHIPAEYWAIAKCNGGWRAEIAFATNPDDWPGFARNILGRASEPVVYEDSQTGRRRFAAYDNGRLTGMLFLAPEPVAVSREWAVSQLTGTDAILSKRNSVLAGRPGAGAVDRGATVCACFGIGANEIAAAVRSGCCTIASVGEATQAGTNCGSCRPEIKRIINDHALAKVV